MTEEADIPYSREVENELRKRLEFKFNDIKSVVKNRLLIQDHIRWSSINQKTQYQYEAWEELNKILDKELHMSLPYDNMLKQKKWELKEEAVESLKKIFESKSDQMRGRGFSPNLISQFVEIIEKSQQFMF